MKSLGREIKNTILIILGILSVGMGLEGFLFSIQFIDGVTGVSMPVAQVAGFPLAVLILIF